MPEKLGLLWQICTTIRDCLWSTGCVLGGCSDYLGAVQEKDEEREDAEEDGGQNQANAYEEWTQTQHY